MSYTVKRGDNLTRIAAVNGMQLNTLLGFNPQIKNPDLIHPGDRITLMPELPQSVELVKYEVPTEEGLIAIGFPNPMKLVTIPIKTLIVWLLSETGKAAFRKYKTIIEQWVRGLFN